jgi:hypothetical protein
MRLLLTALLTPTMAMAVECPSDMKSCKVIYLSPQEEQILVQPGGILSTAADARKLDYQGAVQFFINKIRESSQGEVKADPPQGVPDKK